MNIGSLFRVPDLIAPIRNAVSRIVPEPLGRGTVGSDVDLTTLNTVSAPLKAGSQTPPPLLLAGPESNGDPRNMSPRQIANFAHENYLSGNLSWEEYRMLGFPPELHPAFDQTIGALTGEKAQPDQPKDMIAEWEGKVSFALRYNADNPDILQRTSRILDVLKWQEVPPVSVDA
ncbi:MAG: hypothetical protein HQL37_08815 [Alphaproteobacteria bacterium]|nr:hypothetical protein [Alphaproteobacteria bacterium]